MHLRFERVYTAEGQDPFDTLRWQTLTDADGEAFRLPAAWGAAALAALRGAGVFAPRPPAGALRAAAEGGVPDWLRGHEADAAAGAAPEPERDLRDVLHRTAGGLCHAAFRAGLFDDEKDARIFYDELCHVMLYRIALPELALLASAGLGWAYGPAYMRAYVPAERIAALPDNFAPAAVPHAVLAVTPDAPVGNIARRLRIQADIRALDQTAPLCAVIPAEHSEAMKVIAAQGEDEIDALAKNLGRALMQQAADTVMDACDRAALRGFDTAFNGKLSRAVKEMRAAGVPETLLRRAIDFAQQGGESLALENAQDDLDGSGGTPPVQVVLSVPDDFIETALTGHGFLLREAGEAVRHADADALWSDVGTALWGSGQPQFFFRDSAAAMYGAEAEGAPPPVHLAPAQLAVAQGLVSPAGVEAPGATLNLSALVAPEKGRDKNEALIEHEKMTQAVRLMVAALDAAFALPGLSPLSAVRRPLVMGCSGLAGILMSAGVAYDSDAARTLGAQVAALLSGAAQLASAEMADRLGAYDDYAAESRARLSALRRRMEALDGARGAAKGVMRRLPVLNTALSPDKQMEPRLQSLWQRAYAIGKEQGFRHAHLTGFATSLDMQAVLGVTCRDIAPEASCVRFEGFFGDSADGAALLYGKKLNPAVPRALMRLGYNARQIDDIHSYVVGHGTLLDAPFIDHAALKAKGMSAEMIAAAEAQLSAAQDLRYVFNRWTLGAGVQELPVGDAEDILAALGFSDDDIDAASLHACGAMTLEGAPHLLPEHLDVFDCFMPSGLGIRRVGADAQIAMQAALEPFLCGAVNATLVLDHHTGIDDMQKLVLMAWEKGVKRFALWRDGASLLHSASLLPQKWETSLFAEEEQERGIRPAPMRKRRGARA